MICGRISIQKVLIFLALDQKLKMSTDAIHLQLLVGHALAQLPPFLKSTNYVGVFVIGVCPKTGKVLIYVLRLAPLLRADDYGADSLLWQTATLN